MKGPGLRSAAFRVVRSGMGSVAIPLAMRAGPLERPALGAYRRLPRPGFVKGLPGGADLPNPVIADGLTLYRDERPSITLRELALGAYERETAEYIGDVLPAGGHFLDVGAHVGYFTLLAMRLAGAEGQAWAFEPDPANRALLERNAEANRLASRVTVVAAAAGAVGGSLTFYRDTADTGSGGLYRRPGAGLGTEFSVEVVTLSSWAESQGWPRIDLVKMDIEGAEVDALRGMGALRDRNPETALIVEINDDALVAAGQSTRALFETLLTLGYHRFTTLTARPRRIRSWRDVERVRRDSWWRPPNLLCE